MRQILEFEEHVPVPPMMHSDPFFRIVCLIKEAIRKHKWIEGEKGPATLVVGGQGPNGQPHAENNTKSSSLRPCFRIWFQRKDLRRKQMHTSLSRKLARGYQAFPTEPAGDSGRCPFCSVAVS
jgi:hypothetical protein